MTPTEIRSVFQLLTDDEKGDKPRESQNGVKFRTICRDCNNQLGIQYDAVINDFAIGVGRYLTSSLKLPAIINFRTKPARLIRGILGHLLSAKMEFESAVFDEQVRNILFDEKAELPQDINVFFWVYPYPETIIARDIVMLAVRGDFSNVAMFQILKYFPIAYLVVTEPRYEGLDELTRFRDLGLDDEAEIPIRLGRVEHRHWPELVDRGNIVLGGASLEESVWAKPRRKDRNPV